MVSANVLALDLKWRCQWLALLGWVSAREKRRCTHALARPRTHDGFAAAFTSHAHAAHTRAALARGGNRALTVIVYLRVRPPRVWCLHEGVHEGFHGADAGLRKRREVDDVSVRGCE